MNNNAFQHRKSSGVQPWNQTNKMPDLNTESYIGFLENLNGFSGMVRETRTVEATFDIQIQKGFAKKALQQTV